MGVTVTLASASRLWVPAAQCQHPSKRLARRCTQDPYQTWLGAGNTLSAAVREPNRGDQGWCH